MQKILVTASTCRSRLHMALGAVVVFTFIHILSPGDVKERELVVIQHLTNILPKESFDVNYVQEHLLELDQDDRLLIQYTRIRHLTPPSKLPYSLTVEEDFADSYGYWVANFFQNKTSGIFIEAKATNEREKLSHTLYLEKELGWTGLLIECNPKFLPYLKSHHRKAWVADVCISPTSAPGRLNFSNTVNSTYSGPFKNKVWKLPVKTEWEYFDVQTIPLYTILAVVGWTEIDYFFLDVEGAELSILQTLPLEKIVFKLLTVRMSFYTNEQKIELDDLLKSSGYRFVKRERNDYNFYVHDSVHNLMSTLQN